MIQLHKFITMNKFTLTILLASFLAFSTTSFSQSFKDMLKEKAEETIKPATSGGTTLTNDEIGAGLKEALTKGVEKGVDKISKPDGFLMDKAIKVLMPDEAKKVEKKLRSLGQDKLVDDAITSMNRGAEDASKEATKIFVAAIKDMSIKDAMTLLKGEDNAATQFLKKKTKASLVEKFKPIIKTSLDKVGATKHWTNIFTTYNKIPFVEKVNPNLDEHVTNKAIDGLFIQIEKQEKEIRKNPGARVTDLLKKVFG